MVFLGVLINSVSMSLHLPEEKVSAFKSLLSSFATRKHATCRQLQTLAGKLSWASRVVVGGRIFLQRVLDTLHPLRRPSHKAILSHEFHKDIRWWLKYIDHFNCSYFHNPVRPIVDELDATLGMLNCFFLLRNIQNGRHRSLEISESPYLSF